MLAGKLGAILSVTLCIAGSVLAAPLYGCQNHLTFNGTTYKLTNTDTFSQYIQCIYRLDTGNGGSSQNYCWYDVRFISLTWFWPSAEHRNIVPELHALPLPKYSATNR